VKALVSPEFSGFFLDEFEDRVDLFGGTIEILRRERVEGEGLDSVFEAPIEHFFSYFGADDVPVVGSESFLLRPSSVAVQYDSDMFG
jgi:hypothetical protein